MGLPLASDLKIICQTGNIKETYMDIFTAIILGIVQGLTEFLPVSSSGHLVLLQRIFGISEPALFFNIMVHVGTLAAVVTVLWRDIWAILRRLFQPLTAYLILATIPAAFFGFLFKDTLESVFETGEFLGFAFLTTTVLLTTAELLSRRARAGTGLKKSGQMKWLDALVIGLFQVIALFPGVSRSGATISGALLCKLDRDFAARFSFLMSIPVILGALVLELWNLSNGPDPAATGGIGAGAIIAGTLSAAIVGFFAVRFMLKIIREKSLFGFAIYTGILGLLVLLDQFVTRIVF